MISFHQLKYYVTIIETGSLNKAAKALFISQPALSKQLSQLEKELQVNLLRRKTTGIELTAAGEFFYQKAQLILKQMDLLLEGVQVHSKTPPLRVGALPSVASYLLPEYIERWSKSQSLKPVMTIRDTTCELCEKVEAGELDVAFVQDFNHSKNLLSLRVMTERYDVLLAKNHPLTEKSEFTFYDLSTQHLILHKRPCDIRKTIDQKSVELDVELKSVMDIEFNESIIPFVSSGIGVSIIPRMVSENLNSSSVVTRALVPEMTRTIQAVYRSDVEEKVINLFEVEI